MRYLILILLFIAACTATSTTRSKTQELGSYCGGGYHPIACSPWNPDGDWNFCQLNCEAYDSSDGYCPEITDAELSYCAEPANYNGLHCYYGQPRFTHYCITGEFPLAPEAAL